MPYRHFSWPAQSIPALLQARNPSRYAGYGPNALGGGRRPGRGMVPISIPALLVSHWEPCIYPSTLIAYLSIHIVRNCNCIVLYLCIYIAPLGSAHQSEALPVRKTQGKEGDFKTTERGTWTTG